MARNASAAQMTQIRNALTTLVNLEQTLKDHGDHEVAGVVGRAKREIQLAIRQGQFQSRGENV